MSVQAIGHWMLHPKLSPVLDNQTMVSLAQLSTELGDSLRRATPGSVSGIQLTGVHVSELEDPTAYLEGGELLLTTGIPLGGTASTVSAYVGRLAAKGVAGLGLGLGEGLDAVPPQLVEACSADGIELLVVPDGVPFLDVSRAFWDLAARSGQADLIASLGTQTALARAAMRQDAIPSVVQGLAQALGGWAAYLPADGGAATIWPAGSTALLPHLREETARLNMAGTHSAATFWLHGTPVVEYPILVGRKIEGFLAIGSGRTLTKADRQIIMTVCVLLAMRAQQQEELSSTAGALGSAAAKLVARGHSEAARLLATDVGLPPLPERVRVLAVRMGPASRDLASAAYAVAGFDVEDGSLLPAPALTDCELRFVEDGVAYFLIDAATLSAESAVAGEEDEIYDGELLAWAQSPAAVAEPGTARKSAWPTSGRQVQPATETGAAWTGPLQLAEVAGKFAAVRRTALLAPAGRLVGTSGDDDARADRWAETLAGYNRADLLGTVAAYLRHRGHWEETARALDLHRNSLRHRMAVAEKLLGISIDDPDVAAHLWLALRRRGL